MPVFKMTDGGGGEFSVIPADEFLDLTVLEVEERIAPWKDDDGNDVPRVSFKFRINAPLDYKGRMIWGETPRTFSDNENCKLRNWVQEILGQELPKASELDTDHLIELEVRGITGQRVSKETGKVHTFVSDLMRTKDKQYADEEPF